MQDKEQRRVAAYQAGYALGKDPRSYPHPVPADHQDYPEDFVLGWNKRMLEELSSES